MIGLAQPAGHHPPYHQREAAAPVVVDRVELAVGPPRLPVRLGQFAELGRGERRHRAQRADGPPLADPLAERQERAGQPARLVQPARPAAG